MASPGSPAHLDRLEGELGEVRYGAADGSFSVRSVRDADGQEHTVVGPLGEVSAGAHVVLAGRWQEHARFGRQLRVQTWLVEDPRTLRGLTRYLASGAVKGLGDELARRAVDRFGLETLRILEHEPERLKEVPGIGEKRLAEIRAHWERDRRGRELAVLLRSHGLPAGVAARVQERYGDDALAVLRADPYRLADEVRGIAFATADEVARAMGVGESDPRRARAALLWVLKEAAGQGHCYLPEEEAVRGCVRLQVLGGLARAALTSLVLEGRLTLDPAEGERPVALGRMDQVEAEVAAALAARSGGHPAALERVLAAEARLDVTLNEDQRVAVALALGHRLCVVTGGPGTGKTTIVKVLLAAATAAGETWRLAAPTGRAAQRLAESCGVGASTLHRLLEYGVGGSGFQRGPQKPLEGDAVLVDEASMVDLPLLHALVRALPTRARLVLVGDADQLPSVGPGQVLRDLLESGAVPVARLRQVYRQAAGSGIVRNAHRVLAGTMPVSAEAEEGVTPDFFLVNRAGPEAMRSALLQVVGERLPARGHDPLRDVQVLTPMHRGPLGSRAINEALQDLLNPGGAELQRGGRRLRVGDRVIQVRNDYDNDIFNGDVGRVVALADGGVEVDINGRQVGLVGEQLDQLELAYAISIHKSQGSEYPAVVLVLDRSHHVMLRRSLVYTGMTRARRFCVVLGQPEALRQALGRGGQELRHTRLAQRLRSLA